MHPDEFSITVPCLPLTLNKWSREWKLRNRAQQQWHWRVHQAIGPERRLVFQKLGPFPFPVHISVLYGIAGKGRIDLDNLVPKSLLDALRTCGILADDNIDMVQSLKLTAVRIAGQAKDSFTAVHIAKAVR